MNSVLEQYQVADFLEWYPTRLKLNPDFQRRDVWTPGAKGYLIDTILRRLPIPKIYIRQRVDLETRLSYREVVDGQQRLRAIFEFASDRLLLGKRAGEFSGKRYSTLSPEDQETFLSYPIAVHQLINATDDDVLEVFARLNSYTLPLNPQEKRHAKYQGDFKWAVRAAAKHWAILWDVCKVVTVRERVRMADDQLIAEMFGVVVNGVTDGGQKNIDNLYRQLDKDFPNQEEVVKRLNATLQILVSRLGEILETPIRGAPHFLTLFAAAAHALHGIPEGGIGPDMPPRDPSALTDLAIAIQNLTTLAEVLTMSQEDARNLPKSLSDFWVASSGTTQRIRSRKPRFLTYYRALLPQPLQ